MEPISTTLAALLKERDMSKTDLWTLAGLAPGTVTHYLSQQRGQVGDPRTMATIEAFARALGVEPEYFVEYRLCRLIQVAKDHPDPASWHLPTGGSGCGHEKAPR